MVCGLYLFHFKYCAKFSEIENSNVILRYYDIMCIKIIILTAIGKLL